MEQMETVEMKEVMVDEPYLERCPYCGGKAVYESSLEVVPIIDAETGAYIDAETYYSEFTGCNACGVGFWLEEDEPEGATIPTSDENKSRCSRCDVIHLIAQYPEAGGKLVSFLWSEDGRKGAER